jgi:hypothetical protein
LRKEGKAKQTAAAAKALRQKRLSLSLSDLKQAALARKAAQAATAV